MNCDILPNGELRHLTAETLSRRLGYKWVVAKHKDGLEVFRVGVSASCHVFLTHDNLRQMMMPSAVRDTLAQALKKHRADSRHQDDDDG